MHGGIPRVQSYKADSHITMALVDHCVLNMKITLLIFCYLASVFGLPQFDQHDRNAYITSYDFNPFGPLGYRFSFYTSNGIGREEVGEAENEARQIDGLKVAGKYSYFGPDGRVYTVEYTADENGFHPEGEHLPPAADVKVKKTKPLGICSAAVASCAG